MNPPDLPVSFSQFTTASSEQSSTTSPAYLEALFFDSAHARGGGRGNNKTEKKKDATSILHLKMCASTVTSLSHLLFFFSFLISVHFMDSPHQKETASAFFFFFTCRWNAVVLKHTMCVCVCVTTRKTRKRKKASTTQLTSENNKKKKRVTQLINENTKRDIIYNLKEKREKKNRRKPCTPACFLCVRRQNVQPAMQRKKKAHLILKVKVTLDRHVSREEKKKKQG